MLYRNCCVGTNDGQSYGIGPGNREVNQCVGEIIYIIIIYSYIGVSI